MARKKTETVETADKKPIVKRDKLPEGWTYSMNYIVCPSCGVTVKVSALKVLGHCPICGEKAE